MQQALPQTLMAHTKTGTVAASGVRILQVLLSAHLILLTLQFLVRAFVFDTTFWRDVLLIASLLVWLAATFSDRQASKTAPNTMDRLFTFYLIYGLVTIVTTLVNGLTVLEAVTQFRNYFLPAALYFPAKKAFGSAQGQGILICVLVFINLLLIGDVIGEYLVQQADYPLASIPWYPYMFRTGDRFIGNQVGSVGTILPDDTPILGILGYPHYTVAPLMATFAFGYAFFVEKKLNQCPGVAGSLIGKVPVRLRQAIALLAILAVFVLGVRTHLVSIFLILMVLPFFTDRKLLIRNLTIIAAAGVILIFIGFFEPTYLENLRAGFLSSGSRESTLSFILSFRELFFIVNSPLQQLLLGNANVYSQVFNEVGNFELRLLFFAAAFGVIWLVLFVGIFVSGLVYARRIMVSEHLPKLTRVFAVGATGLLMVYILDVLHYARTMYAPNIDMWVIVLGVLSAIVAREKLVPKRKQKDVPALIETLPTLRPRPSFLQGRR